MVSVAAARAEEVARRIRGGRRASRRSASSAPCRRHGSVVQIDRAVARKRAVYTHDNAAGCRLLADGQRPAREPNRAAGVDGSRYLP